MWARGSFSKVYTHPAMIYSKSTIEALEQGVKYTQSKVWNIFKANNKDRRHNDANGVLVSLLLTLNIFHILF